MEESYEAELQNVSKRFGDVSAVDSVSLFVRQGEFLTLLGPSGCGKTTLLRILAGFETPDAGRVFLGGRDVTEVPPYRRDVTTVFQHYALFPHMNVSENVAFGLERRRLPREQTTTRSARALEMVRMSGLELRQPKELSGGQQQRVALARALVLEPKVLLLDEPLAALDLKLRREMQFELKDLQRRLGISFIYVTHDQEEALTMSDRIAVMNAGHIEQIGRAEEIYERPSTEFVAGFIGMSNILEGHVDSVEAEQSLINIGSSRVCVSAVVGLNPGQPVRLMVRPEKIKISAGRSDSTLAARIKSAVYLGESTQWRLSLDGGQNITVLEQNTQAFDSERSRIGEQVFVSWAPESAVVLKGG